MTQFCFLTVLVDGSHFSCDSLVYDTLLPKETIEVTFFCILRTLHKLFQSHIKKLCPKLVLQKTNFASVKLSSFVCRNLDLAF